MHQTDTKENRSLCIFVAGILFKAAFLTELRHFTTGSLRKSRARCSLLLLCVSTMFRTVPSSMSSCLQLSFTPLLRVSRTKPLRGDSQTPSASWLGPCFWLRDTMAWQSVMFKARGSTVRAGTAAVCLLLRRRRDQCSSLKYVHLNLITYIIVLF